MKRIVHLIRQLFKVKATGVNAAMRGVIQYDPAKDPCLRNRDIATTEQLWRDPNWDCPRCKAVNFGIREICRICGFDSARMSGGVYFGPYKVGIDYGTEDQPQ